MSNIIEIAVFRCYPCDPDSIGWLINYVKTSIGFTAAEARSKAVIPSGRKPHVKREMFALTVDRCKAMRNEAASAGDAGMVSDCDEALAGNKAAARRVARVLALS